MGELISQYQHDYTPPNTNPRLAVAIDCEMGVAQDGGSELIRVSMIDYFTNEVLVDNLVYPSVPMQHLSTKYSGVSWSALNKARDNGTAIRGRRNATRAVWQFVGPETIVVGHSVHNDLKSLRWIHLNVVDTFFTESKLARDAEAQQATRLEAEKRERELRGEPEPEPEPEKKRQPKVGKGNGPFSLKTITRLRLERLIQQGAKGHDSLEDAVAARDVAHWHVRHTEPFRVTENRFAAYNDPVQVVHPLGGIDVEGHLPLIDY
jgi:RNA exonuclease 1